MSKPDGGSFPIRSVTPDRERAPDIGHVSSIQFDELDAEVLGEGPRSRREIVNFAINSRKSGEFKGNKIGFRTKRCVGGIWENDPAKSFTLTTDKEIRQTVQFILAACESRIPHIGGNFLVVPSLEEGSSDLRPLQKVLNTLSQEGKASLLVEMLEQASKAPDVLANLMDTVSRNPHAYAEASAALNLVRYQTALERLKELISTSNHEQDFQDFLTKNPWMFGSEYSELLDQRDFSRGSQQDFVLRRTTDDYIEVIEIKTPLRGGRLFNHDRGRDNYYARSELSEVLGQAQKYIEELERDRATIALVDKEDTLKVRAKIIIGRDIDDAQKAALRRLNGHLHRIEVITFDQLERIASRVVSYLEKLVPSVKRVTNYDLDDDIPF